MSDAAISCPSCGRSNAADARFCAYCGATLVTRVGVQERRHVTAMFADLARSTSMGASLDPEVVRAIVGRFFEITAREVERRGGMVEKFSGDAAMAVFGLPSAHEDDPERAVRAALAIRDEVDRLNEDIQQRHGVAVQARVGIESGEVVVGDPFGGATMATGDAMNLAARLEQGAQPGEIVIGATAWAALRDMLVAEPLGEVSIRGRDTPLAAWRVSAITDEVGRPRGVPGLEAPLTGRDEELTMLLDAAGRARRERKAVLFTILGVPGVGKSRLTREASARLTAEGWRVVRGRCLPYGDGITYWPLVEIVRTLAGIETDDAPDRAVARLRQLAPDDETADRLAVALGFGPPAEGEPELGAKDIAYAFRRLVEAAAADAPLMLIFEDIHWAEPPLLDLIEYLATWTREAPVLIVCPSRPELLDTRPAWGSGRMEASRISLDPLTEDESRSLLAALLTVEDLPPELRQRVLDRAEGNPLFVEEVVRMLIEEGVVIRRDGHWFATQEAANVRVPDSVEALIRARLDTLPPPERVLLQAGAVVGRTFQRSAVAAIAPPDQVPPPIEQHLEAAILRDIITEERTPDEPTFRFRHILIRDVAYNTLPKSRRAELHGSVAEWLRAWAGPRIDEFVEIEAYHLEQAVLLRREMGGSVEPALADAAAAALLASAERAQRRDDIRAQRTFSERGLAVRPSEVGLQLALRLHQAEALGRLGEYTRSGELAATLERDAAAAGRPDIEGRAALTRSLASWISPATSSAQEALAGLRRARDLLEQVGDWRYLAATVDALGYEGWWFGDLTIADERWQEMLDIAREHGLIDHEVQALLHLGQVDHMRGDPTARRRRLDEAMQLAERGANRLTRARVLRQLGALVTINESGEEGRRLLREAASVLDELGNTEELGTAYQFIGDSLFREGRYAEALDAYRAALPFFQEHIGYRPEVERRIAQVLLELGDVAGAEALALQAVDHVAADDWSTVATTLVVLGRVRMRQGRLDDAEELFRQAGEAGAGRDFPRYDEYLAMAELHYRSGRLEEARRWHERLREVLAGYAEQAPLRKWLLDRAAAAKREAGATAQN